MRQSYKLRNATFVVYFRLGRTEHHVHTMTDFWLGILGGLITSVIAFVFAFVVKHWLLPNIRQRLSNQPDVAGIWLVFYDHAMSTPVGEATIKQRFNKLQGTVVTRVSRHGGVRTSTYEFSGDFNSGILNFFFENKGLQGYVTGSGTLQLDHSGDTFSGLVTYMRYDTKKVETFPYALRRQPSSSSAA